MNPEKIKRLEAVGWKIGTIEEFLDIKVDDVLDEIIKRDKRIERIEKENSDMRYLLRSIDEIITCPKAIKILK